MQAGTESHFQERRKIIKMIQEIFITIKKKKLKRPPMPNNLFKKIHHHTKTMDFPPEIKEKKNTSLLTHV